MPTPKRSVAHIDHAAAMIPPAVRMVVMELYIDPDTAAAVVEIVPVLALAAINRTVYVHNTPDLYDPPEGMKARELEGWELHERLTMIEPIILEDGTLKTFTDTYEEWPAANLDAEVFVTPWPPEEDEQRLSIHRPRMEAALRQRIEKDRAERLKAQAQ